MAQAKDELPNGYNLYLPVADFPTDDCYPTPSCNPSCESIGSALKSAGLGSCPTNSTLNMDKQFYKRAYPTGHIGEESRFPGAVASHRGPGTFVLSKHLTFKKVIDKACREPYANDQSAMRLYQEYKDCMEVPFAFGMVCTEAKLGVESVAYCIECPVAGVVFDIVEHWSGEVVFSGVDGGVAGSMLLPTMDAPFFYSHDKRRCFDLVITEMPPLNEDPCKDGPSMLDDFGIMVSAKLCCIDTGNG